METHTHIYFGSEDTREHRLVWQRSPEPAPAKLTEAELDSEAEKAEKVLATEQNDVEAQKQLNLAKTRVALGADRVKIAEVQLRIAKAERKREEAQQTLHKIKASTETGDPKWEAFVKALKEKKGTDAEKATQLNSARVFIEYSLSKISALMSSPEKPFNYLQQAEAHNTNIIKTKALDSKNDALNGVPDLLDTALGGGFDAFKNAEDALRGLKDDHGTFMLALETDMKNAEGIDPAKNTVGRRAAEQIVDGKVKSRKDVLLGKIKNIASQDPAYGTIDCIAEEQIKTVLEQIKEIDTMVNSRLKRAPVAPPAGPVTPGAKAAPAPAPAAPAPKPAGPEAAKEAPLETAVKKFEKAVKDGNEVDANKALDDVNKSLPVEEKGRIDLIERLNKALTGSEKFKNKTVEFDKSGTKLVLVEKTAAAAELPKNWLEQLEGILVRLKKYFDDFWKKENEARCGDLRNMPTAKDELEELKEKQRKLKEEVKKDPKVQKDLDEVTKQITVKEAQIRRMEEQKKRNEEAEQKLKPVTTDNPKVGVRVYTDNLGNLYMVGKTRTEFSASMIVEQERAIVREASYGWRPRGYRMPVVESAYMPVPLQPTINITQIGNVIQGVSGNVTVSGDNIQAAAAHVGEVPRVRPTATAEAQGARRMTQRTTPEKLPMPPKPTDSHKH